MRHFYYTSEYIVENRQAVIEGTQILSVHRAAYVRRGWKREEPMRKSFFVAVALLAAGTGSALADGGGSNGNTPPPAASPFVIWELQGSEGKPFTPMPQLQQMGRMGLSYHNDATPVQSATVPPPLVGSVTPPQTGSTVN